MNLVIATHNLHKTREFADLLGSEFQILDLSGMQTLPDIPETGTTFVQNAIQKALTVSRSCAHELVLGDDSGLEVEALGNAPGVWSARYAGEHASDKQNVAKLLCVLRMMSAANRRARFRCAIALCQADELLHIVEADAQGHIAEGPRGANGFGYDPVFVPEGFSQTFAELTPDLKNQISHRAKATGKLRSLLRDYFR